MFFPDIKKAVFFRGHELLLWSSTRNWPFYKKYSTDIYGEYIYLEWDMRLGMC